MTDRDDDIPVGTRVRVVPARRRGPGRTMLPGHTGTVVGCYPAEPLYRYAVAIDDRPECGAVPYRPDELERLP